MNSYKDHAITTPNKCLAYLQTIKTKDLWSVVDPSAGVGNYQTIEAAISAGEKNIFVRSGEYSIATNETITNTQIVGENLSSVFITLKKSIIFSSGGVSIRGAGATFTKDSTAVARTAGANFNTFTGSNPLINLEHGLMAEIASITDANNLVLTRAYRGPTTTMKWIIFDGASNSALLKNITFRLAPDTASTIAITIRGLRPTVENCVLIGRASAGDLSTMFTIGASNQGTFGAVIKNSFLYPAQATTVHVLYIRRSNGTILANNFFGSCKATTSTLEIADYCYDVRFTENNLGATQKIFQHGATTAHELIVAKNKFTNAALFDNGAFSFVSFCKNIMYLAYMDEAEPIYMSILSNVFRKGTGMETALIHLSGGGADTFVTINGNTLKAGKKAIMTEDSHFGATIGNVSKDATDTAFDLALTIVASAVFGCVALNAGSSGFGLGFGGVGGNIIINGCQTIDNTVDGIRIENGSDKNIASSCIALGNGGIQINDTLGGLNNVVADNITA